MAKNEFGDEIEVNEFGDPIEGRSTSTEVAPVPQDPNKVNERAGKVYDTAVEDNIPLEVADKYFYSTAEGPPSIRHDFFRDPPPDNRAGFSEEWLRQWTGKGLVTKVPIAGGVIGGLESLDLIWAANRLSDPKFDYDEYNRQEDAYTVSVGSGPIQQFRTGKQLRGPSGRSRESDQKQVAAAIKEWERQQQGLTFGGKVAAGISQLPSWMIEFAATGGFASLGDDAAKKAGEKMLRKYAETTAGKIAIKSSGLALGAAIRTSTGLLPRVGEKAINRQALIELGLAEQEGWATSFAKAWGDVAIESFSEETGGLLTKGAGAVVNKLTNLPFGGRYISMLRDAWIATTGDTAESFATQMITKAGYSNILAELGEERIGTILRAATGVSDTKGGFGKRIWTDISQDFTRENLGVELITLLVPGTVKQGLVIGQSLTAGVQVPSEIEQVRQAAQQAKVQFDNIEDAKAFAERAAEVAQREGLDVSISTDAADNSVTVEILDKEGQPIKQQPPKPARKIPEPVKEKQTLSPSQSVTETEKESLGGDPIDKVRQSLQKAKQIKPVVISEQKAERAKRFQESEEILKTEIANGTPVEDAILKSLSAQKGQLTEYTQRYEAIEDQLTPEEQNALYSKIVYTQGISIPKVWETQRALKKLLKGSYLTEGDIKNLRNVFGDSFRDESGKDILEDRQAVSGFWDQAISLWKAGLVTGLKTSGLNILSTMSNSLAETASDLAATPVDIALSKITGERALVFTVKGMGKGTIDGAVKGWNYLATGESERDIGKKLDRIKVNFGTGKIGRAKQLYVDTIFRLLGAEDQPFFYGAMARSLYSQALAQGKNQGLKGKELSDFADSRVDNASEDMIDMAIHDAEVAVFQNRTDLGDLAAAIQQKGNIAGVPVGQIVVPFGRTPSAVAVQIINYTPVGPIIEIVEQVKKGELNQRNLSKSIGRAIVGTGTLYLGGQILKAGLMTLDRPRDEKEKKLWELEGRQPNSIKIDGKWRTIQTLGPLGNVLLIGGHFADQFEKSGSPTEAMTKALSGSAKSFSEQTFVKGMNMAVEAMVDPERSFDRWFTSMAGSVVPTIVADIARANDEIERRTKGPVQRIQSRIPGARKGLPPRVNVFGQDLPRYGGNVLEVMIDPSRPSKINRDVVVDELRRLADKDIKVTPTLLGNKDGFDVLTEEENTAMWKQQGELTYKGLLAIVTAENYDKLHDLQKKEIIERMVDTARSSVRAQTAVMKAAQGVSIRELAESGLFTFKEMEALKYFEK